MERLPAARILPPETLEVWCQKDQDGLAAIEQRRLTAVGLQVQAINPLQTDALLAAWVRTATTDRRDAEIIADLVRSGRAAA